MDELNQFLKFWLLNWITCITYDEFLSLNNVLKEYEDVKEVIKNSKDNE